MLQLKATRPTNKSSKWCLARQGPTSTTEKDDSQQTLYTHAGPVLSTHKSHAGAADHDAEGRPKVTLFKAQVSDPDVNNSEMACSLQQGTHTILAGKSFWGGISRSTWWVSREAKDELGLAKLLLFFLSQRTFQHLYRNRHLSKTPWETGVKGGNI